MNSTKAATRDVLSRLGLMAQVRRLRALVDRQSVSANLMRFPTFDATMNRSLASKADYFRCATMGLAVRRVLVEKIAGAFAEVGVWRGDVSRFVHELAPERTYYLFDTFEGFPVQDLEPGTSTDGRFRDTSVEGVLKNIGDANNIIIRKGYVPDTLVGLEPQQFAFVLLDLDLYDPTLRSLEFFYPRLSRGGYLIVHDYNSPESNWACHRAVSEFMCDKPEQIIEIADEWGSVLFRKI